MSWLARLLPLKARAAPGYVAAVDAYRALPQVPGDSDIRRMRFVVVDVETSGLDPYRDNLLAIGAVAVDAMLMRFEDSFGAYIQQDTTSSTENILVHGIDGTTQTSAPAAADGLAAFLRYARKAPLVAFHADFDRVAIGRALRATLGTALQSRWLDLARLAPAILPQGKRLATLDDWTGAFGIENFRRHDALADAAATAQLLQVVLARAAATGATRLADLTAAGEAQRWLERR